MVSPSLPTLESGPAVALVIFFIRFRQFQEEIATINEVAKGIWVVETGDINITPPPVPVRVAVAVVPYPTASQGGPWMVW